MVVFDPSVVTLEMILKTFWEEHDPTQGYRQGNDIGTQYRSAIYCTTDDQLDVARGVAERYGAALKAAGRDAITTDRPCRSVLLRRGLTPAISLQGAERILRA